MSLQSYTLSIIINGLAIIIIIGLAIMAHLPLYHALQVLVWQACA